MASVLLVAVLGAACGGDGDDAAPSAASKATSSRTEAPAVVRSGGCGAERAPVAAGNERVTITSGGVERWYLRRVPPSYERNTPMPVVVDFHGYSEGAQVHTLMSGLGPFGDEHGFITITPHGSGSIVAWNFSLDSPDQRFFTDLLDDVESDLCVDRRRVFVTGLSNGAMMTSAIACTAADRIAAVAPIAGVRDIDGCKPSRAVPVVAIHGTDDGFVSFDGGIGEKGLDLPAPDGSGRKVRDLPGVRDAAAGPAVPDIVRRWAIRNDCSSAPPAESKVADDVVLVRHRCPDDADVELYRVEGGGHAWPGSEVSKAVEPIVGRTTFSISANEVMWKFFEEHPLP